MSMSNFLAKYRPDPTSSPSVIEAEDIGVPIVGS